LAGQYHLCGNFSSFGLSEQYLVRPKLCNRTYFEEMNEINLKMILRRRLIICVFCVISSLTLYLILAGIDIFDSRSQQGPLLAIGITSTSVVIVFSIFVLGHVMYLDCKQKHHIVDGDVYIPGKKIMEPKQVLLAVNQNTYNDSSNSIHDKGIKSNFVTRTSQLVLIYLVSVSFQVVRTCLFLSGITIAEWVSHCLEFALILIPLGNLFLWLKWSANDFKWIFCVRLIWRSVRIVLSFVLGTLQLEKNWRCEKADVIFSNHHFKIIIFVILKLSLLLFFFLECSLPHIYLKIFFFENGVFFSIGSLVDFQNVDTLGVLHLEKYNIITN